VPEAGKQGIGMSREGGKDELGGVKDELGGVKCDYSGRSRAQS